MPTSGSWQGGVNASEDPGPANLSESVTCCSIRAGRGESDDLSINRKIGTGPRRGLSTELGGWRVEALQPAPPPPAPRCCGGRGREGADNQVVQDNWREV